MIYVAKLDDKQWFFPGSLSYKEIHKEISNFTNRNDFFVIKIYSLEATTKGNLVQMPQCSYDGTNYPTQPLNELPQIYANPQTSFQNPRPS